MNILVTAIGSMSSDYVIQAIKTFEDKISIVGVDINHKQWIYQARLVDKFYQVPKANESNYISQLLLIAKENRIDFIVPLTDPEVDVLSENETKFQDHGIKVFTANPNVIKLCRNKLEISIFFEKVLVVKTIPTVRFEDLKRLANGPIIEKPINGRSSEGIKKYDNVINIVKDKNFVDNQIYQPLMSGSIFTVDVVRDKYSNVVCIPRKELIRTANGAGLSVHIVNNQLLIQLAKTIATKLDILGCMNFEFIEFEGDFYLMDVNPRFSAGVAFSGLVGYDFVKNHLRAFQNEEIERQPIFEDCYATKYYKDKLIHL